MLALARAADDRGKASLSLEQLSGLTGLTTRAVKNCLTELYALGELAHTQGGGKGNPNSYSILLGTSSDTDSSTEAGNGFRASSSGSGKYKPGSGKFRPSKREVASSRIGVVTPYGSNNTSKKLACLPDSPDPAPTSVDVPEGAQEVVAAMTRAGMVVGWRLSADEWARVTALSAHWGADRLVEIIARRWDPARPPQSARYLLRIWDDLPMQAPADPPAGNVVPLRREPGGWRPFRNPAKPSAYQNGF
ncbi:hypothetical protein [Streptomyces mexicanus]|jgi:hypothetical protein|uniref:hypothetical protein n=1 Tax=Streptomyces mexicanus TaxID=178566 RepID=UPI0031E8FBB6